jgi:hypothetical protein
MAINVQVASDFFGTALMAIMAPIAAKASSINTISIFGRTTPTHQLSKLMTDRSCKHSSN